MFLISPSLSFVIDTAQGSERKKWIMRNPEARDLAIFSVSEQYALARAQVGLGQ